MKILFVCRGNVGRSQMAEAIFKKFNNKHEALSAGTKVISKDGESRHGQMLKDLPAAEYVILSLKERGIDVSQNVRTQIDPGLVDWADMIIIMAEQETIPDYLLNSPKAVFWQVDDPKGADLETHKIILNEIEGLASKLIEEKKL